MPSVVGELQALRIQRGAVSALDACGGVIVERRFEFLAPEHRPFLKWTGGKQWLAPLAKALRPPSFSGTYFEPFLGGGAMFFALRPQRARLSDLNEELTTTYSAVRDSLPATISLLTSYPHDRDFFSGLRQAKPRAQYRRAARMIYLNKTAFNGMYRVNKQGQFNVPFGRYVRPTICHVPRLTAASEALQDAEVAHEDFESACERAERGDWIFVDPPYITGHQNNGFLKYNARIFTWHDQERLAALLTRLSDRGVYVLMSNAAHPAVCNLYREWNIVRVERTSLVNSNASSRGLVSEALICNYELNLLKDASV